MHTFEMIKQAQSKSSAGLGYADDRDMKLVTGQFLSLCSEEAHADALVHADAGMDLLAGACILQQ